MRRLGILALSLSAVLAIGGVAQAQGIGAGCYGWGGWYGGYRVYSADALPFYALHPPVYYSLPVPRTYGYSPFAYPPGVMTPEIEFPEAPKIMRNPYVPQTPAREAARERVATAPLRIRNPYVEQPAWAANDDSESVAIKPAS